MGQPNVVLLVAVVSLAACERPLSPEAEFRQALAKQSMGVVRLPPGDLTISEPIRIPLGSMQMEIRGAGNSRVIASPEFRGSALFIAEGAKDVLFADFAIEGNRNALAKPMEMAPPENAFRVWYANNGILADQVEGLRIERVTLRNVASFPVLVSRSTGVRIREVQVSDSGSLNAKGRNNLTGGILIEEGSADFEVRDSTFRGVRGNALWTHSLFTSPQVLDGVFEHNTFERIGRDAIQVGHAKRIRVENNSGREIGYPFEVVDVENGGTPVGIDTAGDVEGAQYVRNRFDEINGKCMDLDGFHDGIVTDNTCTNRFPAADYPHGHFGIVMNNTHPNTHSNNIELNGNVIDGAKYGGLFLMGSNNHVTGNRFLNLNLAGCNESGAACIYKADEPRMLESGIYIGQGVARREEAKGNVIRGNTIRGHKMKTRCIASGPGVAAAANTVETNTCQDK